MMDLENVTAELSDIADQLDQIGSVFNSDWPVKLSERVRAVALQLAEDDLSADTERCGDVSRIDGSPETSDG